MDVSKLVGILTENADFVIVYQLDDQRYPRECRARYLGTKVLNNGTVDVFLSGRPEFGTAVLNSDSIKSAKRSDTTGGKYYFNKRADNEGVI